MPEIQDIANRARYLWLASGSGTRWKEGLKNVKETVAARSGQQETSQRHFQPVASSFSQAQQPKSRMHKTILYTAWNYGTCLYIDMAIDDLLFSRKGGSRNHKSNP
jgi:hypothetical protein